MYSQRCRDKDLETEMYSQRCRDKDLETEMGTGT